jgi:hypothetical protein
METLKDKKSRARHGRAKALLVLLIPLMSGCSDGDVTALKAEALSNYPDFTIGQAFDHRKACASVTWDQSTDERAREIIEYRCIFNVDPEVYTQHKQKQMQLLMEGAAEAKATGQQVVLEQIEKNIAAAKAQPTVISGAEIFQWAKSGDDFTPIFAGREIKLSNGEVKNETYRNVDSAIKAIVDNTATDLPSYAGQTNLAFVP